MKHWPPISPDLNLSDLSVGIIKEMVYQQKVGPQYALLRRILDAATQVKDNPKEMMRTPRSIHRRRSTCMEAEGGKF
jgi:hypothetical protein